MTRRTGKHPALGAPYGKPNFIAPKGRMAFVSELKEPPTDHNRQLDFYRAAFDLNQAYWSTPVEPTYPALTTEQHDALVTYASRYSPTRTCTGKTWRERLSLDWLHCSEPNDLKPALRQVRNTYGPTWLFEVFAYGWLPEAPPRCHIRDGDFVDLAPGIARWSATFDVPQVGARVRYKGNGWGDGTVTGYFVQDGWLGVIIRFDWVPERFVKQNDNDCMGHGFGAEIEVL